MTYGDCLHGNEGGVYGLLCPPGDRGRPVPDQQDDELTLVLSALGVS